MTMVNGERHGENTATKYTEIKNIMVIFLQMVNIRTARNTDLDGGASPMVKFVLGNGKMMCWFVGLDQNNLKLK